MNLAAGLDAAQRAHRPIPTFRLGDETKSPYRAPLSGPRALVAVPFVGRAVACRASPRRAARIRLPCRAFHFEESRERRPQTEFFRIGRVDAGDERLNQPVERLAPEPPADERGHAFVALRPCVDGIQRSNPIRSLPSGLKIGEATTGQIFAGAISMKPSGTGTGFPLRSTSAWRYSRIGRDQAVFESQSPAQIDRPRLVCDERIRPAVRRGNRRSLGMDHAAESRAGLEEGDAEGQRRGRRPVRSGGVPPPDR